MQTPLIELDTYYLVGTYYELPPSNDASVLKIPALHYLRQRMLS